MNKLFYLLIFWGTSVWFNWANAQNTLVEISGQVKDAAAKTPLANATVYIREHEAGATTDDNGQFVIKSYVAFDDKLSIVIGSSTSLMFTNVHGGVGQGCFCSGIFDLATDFNQGVLGIGPVEPYAGSPKN